jgi:hypothetical protein
MKILFVNDLLTATLSALHADASYPVANLASVFLKKIFKSTQNTDSITLQWAADKIVSCVYAGFTNATAIQARLYNSSDTLLSTINLTASDPGLAFAAVATVRKAVVDITSPGGTDAYLGSIGIGLAYTMPDPLADWTPGGLDNSTKIRSSDGQVLINKVPPLRALDLNFQVSTYEEYAAIKVLVEATSRPVFVDPFELAHTKYLPMYADLDGGFANPGKNDRRFNFSLNLVEAR